MTDVDGKPISPARMLVEIGRLYLEAALLRDQLSTLRTENQLLRQQLQPKPAPEHSTENTP